MQLNTLPQLNSLWVGERLGYLEKLCLASARAVGHRVVLFSYAAQRLQGVPAGIEVRDAREVMPESELVSYAHSGSWALGANLFRYALLEKGLGYWIDMDLYFLRPIDLKESFVFGWQDNILINNAVLSVPKDSPFVRELRALPNANRRPPWYGPKRSLLYYWAKLQGKSLDARHLPWGTFGPELVTYLAKKHRVATQAQRPEVFYPVKINDARRLYGPPEIIENMITPDTRTIHMWNGALYGLRDSPPPDGTYIERACRKFEIDFK